MIIKIDKLMKTWKIHQNILKYTNKWDNTDVVHYHKYITNNVNILDMFSYWYHWRSTLPQILQIMLYVGYI